MAGLRQKIESLRVRMARVPGHGPDADVKEMTDAQLWAVVDREITERVGQWGDPSSWPKGLDDDHTVTALMADRYREMKGQGG